MNPKGVRDDRNAQYISLPGVKLGKAVAVVVAVVVTMLAMVTMVAVVTAVTAIPPVYS